MVGIWLVLAHLPVFANDSLTLIDVASQDSLIISDLNVFLLLGCSFFMNSWVGWTV